MSIKSGQTSAYAGQRFGPCGLSAEIWTRIFRSSLEEFQHASLDFAECRRDLCRICRTFREVVFNCRDFWAGIFWDRFSSPGELRESVSRSGNLNLTICVCIREIGVGVRGALLDAMVPAFRRCNALIILDIDSELWDFLRLAVSAAVIYRLQELSVGVGGTVNGVALGVNCALPDLAALRLRGVFFDWGTRPSFFGLSTLVIVDPPEGLSWLDYRYIATNIASLRRLCLRNTGCTAFPDGPLDEIIFPTLQEFTLSFGKSSCPLARMLQRCRMPNLQALHFHADTSRHISVLGQCSAILSTVRYLALSGECRSPACYQLFDDVRGIEELELLGNDNAVLLGVLEADRRISERSGYRDFALFAGWLEQQADDDASISWLRARVCLEVALGSSSLFGLGVAGRRSAMSVFDLCLLRYVSALLCLATLSRAIGSAPVHKYVRASIGASNSIFPTAELLYADVTVQSFVRRDLGSIRSVESDLCDESVFIEADLIRLPSSKTGSRGNLRVFAGRRQGKSYVFGPAFYWTTGQRQTQFKTCFVSVASSLWMCLSVCNFDAENLEALARAFPGASLDRLADLSFSIHSEIAESLPIPSPLERFPGALPPLRAANITRISFAWFGNQSLRGLTALAIVDVAWSLTWQEWQSLAAAASNIITLRLSNVGCSNLPADRAAMIHFPALEDLDFSFGNTCSSSGLFLSRCSAPRLTTFRFHSAETGHIMALSFTMADLSTITHLLLSGICNDAFCYFLFARLTHLESIQIVEGDAAILDAILEGDVRLRQRVPPQGPGIVRPGGSGVVAEPSGLLRWRISVEAQYQSDMRVSTLAGKYFPPEILAIIPLAFGSHVLDFMKYTSNRRSLCLVCMFWKEIIYSHPNAWNTIPISLYSHSRYIQFCIHNSGRAPITLYFNLIPLAATRPGRPGLAARRTPAPPTPAEVVDTIFPLLMAGTPVVQELFMRSADAESCAAITAWLGRIDNQNLRRASMVLEAPSDRSQELLRPPPFTFPSAPPVLSELRLGQSIPPWKTETVYRNLSVLRLTSFLKGRTSPWEDIARILGATQRLTLLQLTNVECRDTPFDSVPNPILPFLTDLILSFGHPSSADIVSHIDMPALRALRLDVYSARRCPRPTIEFFVRLCHHFLRELVILDMGHVCASVEELQMLFACMSKLQFLDLGRGSQQLTEELVSLMMKRSVALESLTKRRHTLHRLPLRTLVNGMPPAAAASNSQRAAPSSVISSSLSLPNEILSLIIEMLFTTPQNQRDVHESVLIREKILSLSILFHALCLAAPGAWTAVCVELQRSDPSQVWAAPEELPALADLDSQLVLSKNRPIHVVFSVPISRQTDDPGRILFRRILDVKDKIESLFFRGASTCQSSWLCPHAVFSEWPILHTTPSLRILLLDAPFAHRPCSVYHLPVPIRLTDLARLKCPFPTRIVVASTVSPTATPSLLPRLTHIHIDTQTSELWAKVFVSCDALECLQYGPKNSLNTHLPILPVVTSLRLLRVHRMSCLPPLTAPNLQVLNVLDSNVGLTSAGLSRITGCTTTKIRTLDLLWNFVSNTEMKAIMDRCPALLVLHLNSDSGNDLRTPIYRELRDRIQLSYLRLGPGRFRAASFSHSPPLNSRATNARRMFDSLSSIAVVTKDCKIAPYPLIWRVRVLNCQGYFCGNLFSRESYSFLRENGFGKTLVAAEIYETLNGSTTVPSVFSIILAFRDRDDAVRAISRGVRQGGSIRQTIQFHAIWGDADTG
ncbi:hypothetical protein C8R46DRAFT_1036202 [Mycena filopes]|nr:hypothetical protein C8R46DRAFT_1036202 [Mycena filopes]